MSAQQNRHLALALASLLAVSVVLGVFLMMPPEAAAGCTHMDTRWVYDGCCYSGYNVGIRWRLQWCNNGTWQNTSTTSCDWVGYCPV